jgi:RNA polymerase sigma factor (sigma-70 family)
VSGVGDTQATDLDAACAGDREAFGRLYGRHADGLRALLYRRTGDQHLAADLAADTFVRAMPAMGRFVGDERQFVAWLRTIAIRLLVDHLRSARYRYCYPAADMTAYDRPSADACWQPDAAAERAEACKAVATILADALPHHADLLRALDLDGIGQPALCARLGVTAAALKSMVHRARVSARRRHPELAALAGAR